jgi:hypothetical protein
MMRLPKPYSRIRSRHGRRLAEQRPIHILCRNLKYGMLYCTSIPTQDSLRLHAAGFLGLLNWKWGIQTKTNTPPPAPLALHLSAWLSWMSRDPGQGSFYFCITLDAVCLPRRIEGPVLVPLRRTVLGALLVARESGGLASH